MLHTPCYVGAWKKSFQLEMSAAVSASMYLHGSR